MKEVRAFYRSRCSAIACSNTQCPMQIIETLIGRQNLTEQQAEGAVLVSAAGALAAACWDGGIEVDACGPIALLLWSSELTRAGEAFPPRWIELVLLLPDATPSMLLNCSLNAHTPGANHTTTPRQSMLDEFSPEQAAAFLVLLRAKVRD